MLSETILRLSPGEVEDLQIAESVRRKVVKQKNCEIIILTYAMPGPASFNACRRGRRIGARSRSFSPSFCIVTLLFICMFELISMVPSGRADLSDFDRAIFESLKEQGRCVICLHCLLHG